MIYLDNAATSFPKAPNVKAAMCDFLDNIGASAGRSAYASSIQSARILFETRKLLASMVGLKDCKRVFFTLNATMAINTALQGFLKPKDKVLITQMEHNAIKRPLNFLKEKIGIEIVELPCNEFCELDLKEAQKHFKGAKLLACMHANNVSGAIIPLDELSILCKKNGVKFLLDAAQSLGCVPLFDVMKKVDFLCFSAHKGLLAPMGVGGLIVSDDFDTNSLTPLVFGGTGSASELEFQPSFLPDKFESGTPNMHAIAGLKAALEWIETYGVDKIHQHECEIRNYFLENLSKQENIKLYPTFGESVGILSFDIPRLNLSHISELLGENGICVRVGLHCSPSSHKTIKSFKRKGTIRLSAGVFTTHSEANEALEVILRIANCKDIS